MAPWVRIAAGVLAVVLVLPLVQFLITIHPPRRTSEITPDRWDLVYEEVTLETEDGLTLAGWFLPAKDETDRTILVGHGYPFDKGNVLPHSLFLLDRFNLFLFDHRSFGDSQGTITTVGLRETRDVHAAVDHLQARDDTEHIGALGFSLSGATILMAQDPAVEAIVADSSYASLDRMTHEVYPLPGPLDLPFVWVTDLYARAFLGAWPSQVSPADSIEQAHGPVLLIHGEDDGTIPPEHAEILHERAPAGSSQLWIVGGAGHGMAHAVAGQAYEERVLAFLEESIGG